uniref:Uncharacterized protein n=1 Tax=Anguilla anguilla TaxID=7936 RepID=A0A0E9WUI4_ANGAN
MKSRQWHCSEQHVYATKSARIKYHQTIRLPQASCTHLITSRHLVSTAC